MAVLTKDYGITLVVQTTNVEYGGTTTYNFFGGSSDRIAMLEFPKPSALAASEYLADAVLRLTLKGEDAGDTDNIIIGLISGSWTGASGSFTTLYGYCNGPTISVLLTTTTTLTEKLLNIKSLMETWAADPDAYSGIYLRKSTMSLVRVKGDACDITTTIYERTAPGAPTTENLSATLAENDPTLSCSGASNGVNNDVSGYEIEYAESANGSTWGAWTALKTISTTALSFSTTVALPSTRGYYRKYRVKALGEYDIDSSWKETASVRKNSAPTAPASVTASPAIYESGGIAVGFSGATDADNNISSHEIQRSASTDGTTWGAWANVNTAAPGSSLGDSPVITRGQYVKYQARAKDAFGVVGPYAASNVVRRNSAPSAPTINCPGTGKTTYNSRPRLLVTVGSEADSQAQTLSASGFTASTPGALAAGNKLIMCRSTDATPGAVSASVISTDSMAVDSVAANKSLTYTAPSFTDAVLQAGGTARKAAHINELRTMVNTVRDYYGMSAYSWAETITAGTTPLSSWSAHIAELRTAIDAIVVLVNAWDSTATANKITLPAWIAISAGEKPRADVLEQIRAAIVVL